MSINTSYDGVLKLKDVEKNQHQKSSVHKVNPVYALEGKYIARWFLNDRYGTPDVISEIILAYIDDAKLEEMYKKLKKLQLT